LFHLEIDKNKTKPLFLEWNNKNNELIPSEFTLKTRYDLQLLMQQKVGIVRNDSDLIDAKNQLENWKKKV